MKFDPKQILVRGALAIGLVGTGAAEATSSVVRTNTLNTAIHAKDTVVQGGEALWGCVVTAWDIIRQDVHLISPNIPGPQTDRPGAKFPLANGPGHFELKPVPGGGTEMVVTLPELPATHQPAPQSLRQVPPVTLEQPALVGPEERGQAL